MEVYEVKRQLHQPAYGSRAVSRTPSPAPASPQADTFRHLTPSPPPPPRVCHPPSPPVPTHPVAPTAPEPPGPQSLMPCDVCGRTFLPASLAKHTKICEKTAAKKRKTFDSSRQRREGTDLEQFLPKNFGLPENSPFLEKSPPQTAKTPARKTQSIRSARTKPAADLSRCPHCGRAFGSRAFERHVEWCADKAKILPATPHNPPREVAEAKHRLAARTQYKAPLARSRRSLTRDKASNSRSTSVESTSTRDVSPPPPPPAHPPRDGGDFKYRSRPSEGGFSTEYNEDSLSPHVPVIRHKRGSGGDPAGDAARARHARLAKDLNSNNSNNITESVFPSSVKRSTSLLDSLPKKVTPPHKMETIQKKRGYKTEEARMEQEFAQSLKEFDKFYENEQVEDWMGNKIDPRSYNRKLSEKSNTIKKESRSKESKAKYEEEHNVQNNHATPNGKSSNDSAYSSLNRISPSKLTICHAKETAVKTDRGTTPPPNGSDSGGSHKGELRAMSSDEFLALERSAEMLDQPLDRAHSIDKEIESYKNDLEKRASAGRRTPSWRSQAELSSSSSESSLPAPPPPPPPHSRSRCATPSAPEPRLSRFCHECGSKFHIHTAKFCTECGVKRLSV